MNPIFYSPELDRLIMISGYRIDNGPETKINHIYQDDGFLFHTFKSMWDEADSTMPMYKYDWVFVGYL